jgi:hypothetical protein
VEYFVIFQGAGMKKGLPGLVVVAAVIAGVYLGIHTRKAKPRPAVAAASAAEAPEKAPEAQQAEQMVTVAGPLANYMDRKQRPQAVEEVSHSSQPTSSDHIGPSPQGTSGTVLHKTFTLQSSADFPFEIPAHAAMPRLHGTYQSFMRQGEAGPQDGDVEFLVMNERQFSDAASGRPAEALFSADASHAQDVNFSLPASRNQSVKYYLVFRNDPESGTKKTVQADFTVDF